MGEISDERREVAAKLRQMADAHYAVETSRVARAIGLEYEVYGTVAAFNSAAVQALADLIDPTCEVDSIEPVEDELGQTVGYEFHLTCGHAPEQPFNEPPAYCHYCGARVVDGYAN
jgi:hypothetical protein